MKDIVIKSKDGNIIATITLSNEPHNKFEELLADNLIARCRDILQEWLPDNRPTKVRSFEYFGYYYNPDRGVILDDAKESDYI